MQLVQVQKQQATTASVKAVLGRDVGHAHASAAHGADLQLQPSAALSNFPEEPSTWQSFAGKSEYDTKQHSGCEQDPDSRQGNYSETSTTAMDQSCALHVPVQIGQQRLGDASCDVPMHPHAIGQGPHNAAGKSYSSRANSRAVLGGQPGRGRGRGRHRVNL